jgi:predicted anti-sigma-YlaC factor YlaD
MDCAEVRRLLEAMVDGDLDRARRTAVRDHLRQCAACAAASDEAASLPSRLRALSSPDPPPSLVASVLARVPRRQRLGSLGWGLLAPEALLVAFIVWYVSGPTGLADLAGSTTTEVFGLLAWASGLGDQPPAAAAVDGLLTIALAILAAVCAGHLAILARTGPRRAA